jgi:hypothetical protein
MKSAIQGIARAEMAKEIEPIQTGAMHVQSTLPAFIQRMREILDRKWIQDELPKGDSRCRDHPPSEALITEAIKGLRKQYGQDICWAQNNGKWFVCGVCLKQSLRREQGFSSEQERQSFLEDVAAHSADHQNARAH